MAVHNPFRFGGPVEGEFYLARPDLTQAVNPFKNFGRMFKTRQIMFKWFAFTWLLRVCRKLAIPRFNQPCAGSLNKIHILIKQSLPLYRPCNSVPCV